MLHINENIPVNVPVNQEAIFDLKSWEADVKTWFNTCFYRMYENNTSHSKVSQ